MKNWFKFCLIFSFLIFSCADSDTTDYQPETNSEGYYLNREGDSCILCYRHCDDENLSKATVGDIESYVYIKYATVFVSSNYRSKSATNYSDTPIKYTFNLYDSFETVNYPSICKLFTDINFYSDGHCVCYPLTEHKAPFSCFKIYSNKGAYYIKFSFFKTKQEKNFYGSNYENLTLDDIVLDSEEVYQYSSSEYSFALLPLDKVPLLQE